MKILTVPSFPIDVNPEKVIFVIATSDVFFCINCAHKINLQLREILKFVLLQFERDCTCDGRELWRPHYCH